MLPLFISITLLLFTTGEMRSEQLKRDSTKTFPKKAVTIKDILTKHSESWMKVKGVVGTGEGLHNNKPCIKVFVSSLNLTIKKEIPSSVNSFPVIIEVVGEVIAR